VDDKWRKKCLTWFTGPYSTLVGSPPHTKCLLSSFIVRARSWLHGSSFCRKCWAWSWVTQGCVEGCFFFQICNEQVYRSILKKIVRLWLLDIDDWRLTLGIPNSKPIRWQPFYVCFKMSKSLVILSPDSFSTSLHWKFRIRVYKHKLQRCRIIHRKFQ